MCHRDPNRLCADGQIHRAADQRALVWDHRIPISKITVCGDLKATQHGDIDMAPADHCEGHGRVRQGCAGLQGYLLAAGIDQIRVGFVLARDWADAYDAVFRLKHKLAVFRRVVGGQHRRAQA